MKILDFDNWVLSCKVLALKKVSCPSVQLKCFTTIIQENHINQHLRLKTVKKIVDTKWYSQKLFLRATSAHRFEKNVIEVSTFMLTAHLYTSTISIS